jgi:hypothetical protein
MVVTDGPFEKGMILNWSKATGSDHEIIEWELEVEMQEEAEGTQVIGWILASMMQEDMKVAEELWRERAKERAHLRAESTWDEVESEAEWCQSAHVGICPLSILWHSPPQSRALSPGLSPGCSGGRVLARNFAQWLLWRLA